MSIGAWTTCRGDMNTRFEELRADMNRWMGVADTRFGIIDQRFGELRGNMNARFDDMNTRFKTLTRLIMVWFSFLTSLTVIFKFLRF